MRVEEGREEETGRGSVGKGDEGEKEAAFFPLNLLTFSPFAPFASLALRRIGFALTDDFDERGMVGQIVEPLAQARRQFFACE